jgi:hypothetical protein
MAYRVELAAPAARDLEKEDRLDTYDSARGEKGYQSVGTRMSALAIVPAANLALLALGT